MAETVRDVVIRIALQQVQTQLRAPDISPAVQAEKLLTAESKAQMDERIKWANKGYGEGARSSINFHRNASREIVAIGMRQQAELDRIEGGRMIGRQLKETIAAREAEVAAIDKQRDSLSSVRGAWLGMAESALWFGRAAALGLQSANGDAQELLNTLVKFQSAFDVLQGAQGIIRNIGTAFGASGGAVSALLARVNAVGVAVTATAAASFAAYKLGQAMFTPGAVADQAEQDDRAFDLERRRRAIAAGKRDPGGKNLNPFKARNAQQELDFGARDAGLEEAFRKDQDFAEATFKRRFDFEIQQSNRAAEIRQAALGREMTAQEKLADIEKQRADQQRIVGEFKRDIGRTEENFAQAAVAKYQELLKLDQQRVNTLRQQGMELQNNLQKQYDQIKAATQQLDAATEYRDRLKQTFGELTDLEQEEAKQIAERIKAGTASQADTKRLGDLGLGDLASEERRRQALQRAGGFDSIFQNATGRNANSDVEVAQSQLDNAEVTGANGENVFQMANRLQGVLTEERKAVEELVKTMEEESEARRILFERSQKALKANRDAAGG